MSTITAPLQELQRVIHSQAFASEMIDFEVLNFLGIFVLKKAFASNTINQYSQAYFEAIQSGDLKKTDFHLTEVKLDEQQSLRKIVQEPEFIKVASLFFNGRVGSDFIRIVKKDANHRQPVFTHQDTGYQIGGFERYSFFIALTDCDEANGGLAFYPGTHHFGYLGDVGEIKNILPPSYPKVTPQIQAGDILIMHSATWHQSPENTSGRDRVYLEVHIQDIDEPTTRLAICGERKSPWSLSLSEDDIFKNSRTQRLRGLYRDIESLKNQLASRPA
ncbi:MAG: hypothetical protein EOP36_00145 [Rubrivivax sp.]|nr:MAG: hypothetical protein EOP36_00145 [Rubrivivax sp.]